MKLCTDLDPDLFFTPETVDEAKAVCANCPAREACLRQAVNDGEEYGVWGGRSAIERALDRWYGLPAIQRWDEGAARTLSVLMDNGLTPEQAATVMGLSLSAAQDAIAKRKAQEKAERAEERWQLVAELTRKGKTKSEIADLTGLSATVIARGRRQTGSTENQFIRANERRQRIADLARKGRTRPEISMTTGLSLSTIARALRQAGMVAA